MALDIIRRTVPPEHVARLTAQAISPMLARLYAGRGITQAQEVDHRLARLPAPSLLKGMDSVIARLSTAIDRKERICIVADYDADGATACAVGIRGLRAMGAQVSYLVPNRFEYGYGLTPEIVALALRTHAPSLILTVDNGIASVEGVATARDAGVDVIVTDHHLPGPQLPEALIVNPNQPGCGFPSKALAGVGVMFYVLMALRAARAQQGARAISLAQWLDIVAVGTVADVVALDGVNRILVDQGLRRMRAGHACAGVRALFEVAGRSLAQATASDLGFVVGPRLNAAGRLADISLGIECLLTDDPARAQEIARALDALNRERREIESGIREEAMRTALAHIDASRYGICLYDPTWHQGVVGIVAGRIKDATHRPTIVFAPGNEEGVLRGSGRSIAGFHLRDALDLVSKRHPELIDKFGGHAMAAGLALRAQRFDAFARAFEAVAREWLTPEQLKRVYITDGPFGLPPTATDEVEALQAAVWGQGFAAPLFDEIVEVVDHRVMGGKHLKLRVRREDGSLVTALRWNESELPADVPTAQLQIVFRPVVNTYQDMRNVEFIIDAWAAVNA